MRVAGHCGSDSGQRRVGGGSVEPAVPPVGCVVQTLVLLSTAETGKTTVGAAVPCDALMKQSFTGHEDGNQSLQAAHWLSARAAVPKLF